jgi:hypothetical protein
LSVAVVHAITQRPADQTLYDVDGWGWLIPLLKAPGGGWLTLFQPPSLWKGPVIPFLFGLSYKIAGFDSSVLAFNALCYAASAIVLFLGFCRLGASLSLAAAATIAWSLYVPNSIVFAYYFAEPVIGLLSALTIISFGDAIVRQSRVALATSGVFAGLLLLSRPPFILVVAGLPVIAWLRLRRDRMFLVGSLLLGMMASYLPWPLYNAVRLRAFIPFTAEGGKILFQGVYLAGDDIDNFNVLRAMPGFAALEARETMLSPVEQYHYWQRLAKEQIRANRVGQLRLMIRKSLRFWVYLPQFSWRPAWKTAVVAALTLPLALFGLLMGRKLLLVQLCALWIGGLWAVHSVAHSQLRYNFPVLPMLFLLASFGASMFIRRKYSPIIEPGDLAAHGPASSAE